MLRFASVPVFVAGLSVCVIGCAGPVEADCQLRPPEPKLNALHDRYALGSRATIDLSGDPPLTLESSDPSVVRVDRVGHGTADLSFVGSGEATLALRNETEPHSDQRTLQVAPHQTFTVVLSEVFPIPIGQLSGETILAGDQHFLVLYLDSSGQRLYGFGLAEFVVSPGVEFCRRARRSLEHRCLFTSEAGSHVLEVTVGRERLELPFRTVLERDIVEIEVLQPDEGDLAAGTWVQVDVVGVTQDGTHVASVHPLFVSEEDVFVGYLAYQFFPSADPASLKIEALGRSAVSRFRGEPSDETAVGCASSDAGERGPAPAMLTLAGLALVTHKRSRSA